MMTAQMLVTEADLFRHQYLRRRDNIIYAVAISDFMWMSVMCFFTFLPPGPRWVWIFSGASGRKNAEYIFERQTRGDRRRGSKS